MIYEIKNKYYLKVQGYYIEVDVTVDNDDVQIIPTGNKIEITQVKDYLIVNLDDIKNKTLVEEDKDEEPIYKPRRSFSKKNY